MTRRISYLAAAAVLLAVVLGQTPAADESDAKSPNILFITIDTLRADHLSSYGYHRETSPNIDKLAAGGVRFAQAFLTTSRTGPSHISMFTSRFPQEHGVRLNGYKPPKDSKWLALPQVLQRFGYRTAAYVSSYVLSPKMCGIDRWFEEYDYQLGRTYQGVNSERWAEDVTPKAITWLDAAAKEDDPFFLWVHYFDPHSNYREHKEYMDLPSTGGENLQAAWDDKDRKKNQPLYDSEIRYTDEWVGKLLARLDELEIADNTIVVLTADHGESIGEDGKQGHGSWVYTRIVHVPLIVRYPGALPAGRVVEEQVSHVDIAPTLLGLTLDPEKLDTVPSTFSGQNLADPLREDGEIPERVVRFVSYTGQKWHFPKWMARLWLGDLDSPTHMGKTLDGQHYRFHPNDEELYTVDLGADPLGVHPKRVDDSSKTYQRAEEDFTRWFEATNLAKGETTMDEKDEEVLKSLGYIQ